MKASLVLDQWADVDALTEDLRGKIAFKAGHKGKLDAYFPAGTVFEGDQAVLLCKTGQAKPIDKECCDKAGMTEHQLAVAQVEYKMNSLGINRKEDRELFRAGIILGYDNKLQYIPGPNWDKYQLAKLETEEDEV
jgi:hypothetical protein